MANVPRIRKMLYSLETGNFVDRRTGHFVEYCKLPWLVLKWARIKSTQNSIPERMVCLDGLRFSPPVDNVRQYHYTLIDPLPDDIFSGVLSPKLKDSYEIWDNVPLQMLTSDLS